MSWTQRPLPTEGKFLAYNSEGEQAVVWLQKLTYGHAYVTGQCFIGCEHDFGEYAEFKNITHWKPLDEPPTN